MQMIILITTIQKTMKTMKTSVWSMRNHRFLLLGFVSKSAEKCARMALILMIWDTKPVKKTSKTVLKNTMKKRLQKYSKQMSKCVTFFCAFGSRFRCFSGLDPTWTPNPQN